MRSSLRHGIVFIALFVMAMWRADFARADDNPDDDWKGPGWYQVFYSTDVYLIYSGPYTSQDACIAYVKSLSDDYMSEMTQKYGTYGDEDNGWLFECMPLNTKDDWHELDQ